MFKNAKISDNPTFIMLGGRGGSGKSKFKNTVYDPNEFVVLDADRIKEMFTKYDKDGKKRWKNWKDSYDEYNGYNAWQFHEESADILDRALNYASKKGVNVVLDCTMNGLGSSKRRLELFKNNKHKYNIEAHYMFLPREKAAHRAVNRRLDKDDGRYVPIQKILDMDKNEENFIELVRESRIPKWSFNSNDVPFGKMPKYVEGNIEGGIKWKKK